MMMTKSSTVLRVLQTELKCELLAVIRIPFFVDLRHSFSVQMVGSLLALSTLNQAPQTLCESDCGFCSFVDASFFLP